MKLSKVSIAILFASMLLMMSVSLPKVAATNGPREEDMIEYYYGNVEAAYGALSTGQVDLILYELNPDLYASAIEDENLVCGKVADSGFYEFDLNNNYSIMDAPDYRSPMNYSEMRQAIAMLTDKDFIVNSICGGFSERIDQMIAAPYKGWGNASMWDPNYPWDYNSAAASTLLDTVFPQNDSQPNPYYDSGFAGSTEHLRNYPVGHEREGKVLDPLLVFVRSDDSRRFQAGQLVYGNMRRVGIPVDPHEGPKSSMYDQVMGDFNYHLYTGGWSVGRFPPLSSFGLYHSFNAFPYGSNYVTGSHFPFVGSDPLDPLLYRTHPKLDQLLYDGNYATTYAGAVTASKKANGLMTELCVNVPLWSSVSYWCWRKNLLGVVNMEGSGPHNGYTFMNMYKEDGSAVKVATINSPNSVNIIYSNWVYDYNTLDRMNLYGGVDVPPYDLSADQPGFIKNFLTTTWDGGTKTLFVQNYVSDGYFVDPVTGDQDLNNIDAITYYKNAWFDYQVGDGWFSSGFVDLHHVGIVNDSCSEIYFNTLSYWNTYYCQGPLRPLDDWVGTSLVVQNTQNIVLTAPDTPGAIALTNDPYWISVCTFNAAPLTLGTDYDIVLGDLYIYTALGAGTLHVEYLSPGDCHGYTPGNIAWQTIFKGAGMYYATAFAGDVGGSITFKANRAYYMQTPWLGEIDFVKDPYDAGPPEAEPYYIDVGDLALVDGAYGSSGIGGPTPRWWAGADLAPQGGLIDIFDVATVTGFHWLDSYDPPV